MGRVKKPYPKNMKRGVLTTMLPRHDLKMLERLMGETRLSISELARAFIRLGMEEFLEQYSRNGDSKAILKLLQFTPLNNR